MSLKVLDFAHHEGMQYEFFKLGYDFDLIVGGDWGNWSEKFRPLPDNVHLLKHAKPNEINYDKYEVLIVHDYKQYQATKNVQIPKILIMHCSPRGQGNPLFKFENLEDYYVIFPTYADQREWAFECSHQRTIWHGFDPDEWPTNIGNLNKVLVVGRKIQDRGAILGVNLIDQMRQNLALEVVGDKKIGLPPPQSFGELKQVYREYSVYFNPTLSSSMPRSRGEAMITGMPVVTTGFFDEARFIENGVNGFVSNDAGKLNECLLHLLYDANLRSTMRANMRETAIELFHIKRFLKEWHEVFSVITGKQLSPIEFTERKKRVLITKKDSSGGGGVVSVDNMRRGLREAGFDAKILSINSKGWVTSVDDVKLPPTSARIFNNFIINNPCDILIVDDIDRLEPVRESLVGASFDTYLCILGNPQVHHSSWVGDGILNFGDQDYIKKIFCRPTFARYLQRLFGKNKVIYWIGGQDGEVMRAEYGCARWKHPKDGALIISAHRGTDWWKNPTTAILTAYAVSHKYPQVVYFKPSAAPVEKQLIETVSFDIQYGGTAKEGMERELLLETMSCAQLGLEFSYAEGFPRAVSEMSQFGVPVLQGPDSDWLYDNKFLTEHLIIRSPNDADEATEKALRLLEDQVLWEEVSAACIEFYGNFTVKSEAEMLLQHLELEGMGT